MMTISQLLKKNYNIIESIDSQLLLAHILKKSREYILTHGDEKISFTAQVRFNRLVTKRKKGIPLAYLTGHKEFFGLDFLVNKHTLVPRPDTEVLVETVVSYIMKHIAYNKQTDITLVDIGTGTGCIPIAIQKTIQQCNNVTINTIATDISKKALRIAKQNAKKHNTQITFLHGNLLKPLIKTNLIPSQPNTYPLIVTANLPYLTKEQFEQEPSIQHEPKSALVADKNGLALYEELLKQIVQTHTTYHIPHIICFFEIDPGQMKTIKKIISTYLPDAKIKILKDLSGFDRVVEIQSSASSRLPKKTKPI